MNIDDLTIGEAKQLAAMFGGEKAEAGFTPHIGKKCIIRTFASGVHFGTLKAQSGRQVELSDSRRLWKWHAEKGISLSDVAVHGIVAAKSRICASVPSITILDALEVIPVSESCADSIEDAPEAQK